MFSQKVFCGGKIICNMSMTYFYGVWLDYLWSGGMNIYLEGKVS